MSIDGAKIYDTEIYILGVMPFSAVEIIQMSKPYNKREKAKKITAGVSVGLE